jgi:hypothetical protein
MPLRNHFSTLAADVILRARPENPRAYHGYWLELGDGQIARFYHKHTGTNFLSYAAKLGRPELGYQECAFWQNPHDTESPSVFFWQQSHLS